MVQPLQKDKWEYHMCFHRQRWENGIFFINDFIISPENKNTVHISGISEYLES